MTHTEAEAALERCEAATKGPWANNTGLTVDTLALGAQRTDRLIVVLPEDAPEEDAEFIAHARTDLPAAIKMLMEAAEALQAVVDSNEPWGIALDWLEKWEG